MLSYAYQVSMCSLESRGFRNTVLRTLVSLYRGLDTPDYVNMCQCLIFLDDSKAVAQVLKKLSKDSEVTHDRNIGSNINTWLSTRAWWGGGAQMGH